MVEVVGRVFAAVPLSPEARLALARQIEDLDIPGKVSRAENWHLTLRFLGTVDRVTYERFLHAIGDQEHPEPFTVSFDGLGAFPNTRRAAVVWAGVDQGIVELELLNELAESAAQAAGLAAEERPYRPHLTLARVRPPQNIAQLESSILDVSYLADRMVVYRSNLGRGGARYEALEEFRLSR